MKATRYDLTSLTGSEKRANRALRTALKVIEEQGLELHVRETSFITDVCTEVRYPVKEGQKSGQLAAILRSDSELDAFVNGLLAGRNYNARS